MSKPFKKVSSEVGLNDTLMMGKFKGCRVCDILADEYEYLLWLDSNKMVKFSQEVLTKIQAAITERDMDIYYSNEVAPYLDDFDDLPF